MLAMGLFSAGTLLAAISPGFWLLLPARIVQASGTAVMLPLLMTTVLTLVPIERRGVVMGNISIAISVAPAIGPTLSGLILQYLSWRFMFVLVLPIALAALVYGARDGWSNVGEPGQQKLDVLSVLLSVPAFGGIVYGLSQLGRESADAAIGRSCSLVIGVVCLLTFGLRQRRLARGPGSPLLEPATVQFPDVQPQPDAALHRHAVPVRHGDPAADLSADRAGIDSLPTGLMLLPGRRADGRARTRRSAGSSTATVRRPCASAARACRALTMWSFSTVGAETPLWLLVGLHMLLMVALACLFTPCFTTGLNPLPPDLYSHGSAILSTLQQVAGAAGTALLVAIMSSQTATLTEAGLPELAALNGGISLALSRVAALVSRRRDRLRDLHAQSKPTQRRAGGAQRAVSGRA